MLLIEIKSHVKHINYYTSACLPGGLLTYQNIAVHAVSPQEEAALWAAGGGGGGGGGCRPRW